MWGGNPNTVTAVITVYRTNQKQVLFNPSFACGHNQSKDTIPDPLVTYNKKQIIWQESLHVIWHQVSAWQEDFPSTLFA